MRYSAQSLDYGYTLRSVVLVGAKDIKEARNCGLVFCTLTDYQVETLKSKGIVVKVINLVHHSQVGTPRKVEPTGESVFSGSDINYAAGVREVRNYFTPPISGRGHNIAILDTGIRASHEGFGDRVIYSKNFSDSPSVGDVFGHGTGVAWIAAGGGPEGLEAGVAPEANLLSIKVLGDDGQGSEEAVVMAIDELIQMKKDNDPNAPTIMNMSLGTPDDGDPNNPVRVACRAAHEELLDSCAAAGNDGPSRQTVNCPASDPIVWASGAISPRTWLIMPFSGRGPTVEGIVKPDLVSFGDDILVADSESDTAYAVKAGTSFASAFIIGIGACALEALERSGELGIAVPGFPGAVNVGGMWLFDYVREHPGEFCVKPEGVLLEKDNDYGYGIPMGPAIMRALASEAISLTSASIMVNMMVLIMLISMMGFVTRRIAR